MQRIFQNDVSKMCFSAVFTDNSALWHNKMSIFDQNRQDMARWSIFSGQNIKNDPLNQMMAKNKDGLGCLRRSCSYFYIVRRAEYLSRLNYMQWPWFRNTNSCKHRNDITRYDIRNFHFDSDSDFGMIYVGEVWKPINVL